MDEANVQILLLSTILRHREDPEKVKSHNFNDPELMVLNALTTVAYIGTPSISKSPSINAIAKISAKFIFTQNHNMGPSNQEGLVEITVDANKGSQVLANWETICPQRQVILSPDKKKQKWEEQVEDLACDDCVISYLKSEQRQIHDLTRFQFFIHNRSEKKLAFRVRDFRERWAGQLPFDILWDYIQELPSSHHFSKSFEILLNDKEYMVINPFMQAHKKLPELNKYTFQVDHTSIRDWVKLFQSLFNLLEKSLLNNQYRVKSSLASLDLIKEVVILIGCIRAFRTIIKYVLFLPGVPIWEQSWEQALASAVPNQKILGKQKGKKVKMKRTIYLTTYRCPNRVQRDLFYLVEGCSTGFFDNTSFFICYQRVPDVKITEKQVSDCLKYLPPHLELAANGAKRLIASTAHAKLHAEAALMVNFFLDPEIKEIILRELLNEVRPGFIKLSVGTHGTIFPWLPPPGLPTDICEKLLHILQELAPQIVEGHSRQSSGTGSEIYDSAPGRVEISDRESDGKETELIRTSVLKRKEILRTVELSGAFTCSIVFFKAKQSLVTVWTSFLRVAKSPGIMFPSAAVEKTARMERPTLDFMLVDEKSLEVRDTFYIERLRTKDTTAFAKKISQIKLEAIYRCERPFVRLQFAQEPVKAALDDVYASGVQDISKSQPWRR
ncbi:hypothetical protein DFH05DRAFT_1464648 [Lentinula detonsa]|uniref:Uncharacterized protein n=1 Tax=Lentinula detonsa TaxID=2804962 RepID=A0A9W8NPE3_9AGAR|nr:hypothetical protein DFH05DRAFT_1464648 [Lentinula detonsa]